MIDPLAVWTKILEDSLFNELYGEYKEQFRPYVKALPNILTDFLDLPVSFVNLTKARIAFIKFGLRDGFYKLASKSIAGGFDQVIRDQNLQETYDLLRKLQAAVLDPEKFLETVGKTEEEYLFDEEVGLNKEAMVPYSIGSFTIGELLKIQPKIFIVP